MPGRASSRGTCVPRGAARVARVDREADGRVEIVDRDVATEGQLPGGQVDRHRVVLDANAGGRRGQHGDQAEVVRGRGATAELNGMHVPAVLALVRIAAERGMDRRDERGARAKIGPRDAGDGVARHELVGVLRDLAVRRRRQPDGVLRDGHCREVVHGEVRGTGLGAGDDARQREAGCDGQCRRAGVPAADGRASAGRGAHGIPPVGAAGLGRWPDVAARRSARRGRIESAEVHMSWCPVADLGRVQIRRASSVLDSIPSFA